MTSGVNAAQFLSGIPLDRGTPEDTMRRDSTTLRRGIEILMVLQRAATVEANRGWRNQRIADFLGLDKSQVSRTLSVLQDAGLVVRDPELRTYRLSSQVFSLGMRAGDQQLMRMGAPVIREVVRVTRRRSYLVVRDDIVAVTVWSDQPPEQQPVINSIGMTYSIAETETGRALLYATADDEAIDIVKRADGWAPERHAGFLSSLRADRANGFSLNTSPTDDIVRLAVPVWSTHRKVVAAIGTAWAGEPTRQQVMATVRVLLSASADLTAQLTAAYRNGSSIVAVPYRGYPRRPSRGVAAPPPC